MRCIIANILTLVQHLFLLNSNPERYRPKCCLLCGKDKVWFHGCYTRKSDRTGKLGPIPILRFFCPDCNHTFSVLPECIPPRRWYLWETQQAAIEKLLEGQSLTSASQDTLPTRWTLSRWRNQLQERFDIDSYYLKSWKSYLGRAKNFTEFWQIYLADGLLSTAMIYLNSRGHSVP
jgi:hypothetical protein